MKLALIFNLLALLALKSYAQTTLFQQDFSAGGTPSAYVDAVSPGITKFTDISVTVGSNATPTITIKNGAIELARLNADNGGGQCRLVRSIDLSATATSLYIQFTVDIAVGNATLWSPGTGAAFFNIGNGTTFDNNGTTPVNAETFGKLFFSIGGTAQAVTWTLAKRVNSTTTNGTTYFQGKHLVTWVLNRDRVGTLTYVRPNGVSGLESLGPDRWDAWVDGTLVLDKVPATTAGIDLRKFKFIFDGAIGTVTLDDFLIRDVSGALPVVISNFKAVATVSRVELSWQTPQLSSSVFSVERSADAKEFTVIGNTEATEPTDGPRVHTFTDNLPLAGTSYYRLRQTDTDGTFMVSKIVAVERPTNMPNFAASAETGLGMAITIYPENLTDATYQLTTITGQTVLCHQRKMPDGRVTLLPHHSLPSGIYLLTASTETTRVTRRLQVR